MIALLKQTGIILFLGLTLAVITLTLHNFLMFLTDYKIRKWVDQFMTSIFKEEENKSCNRRNSDSAF